MPDSCGANALVDYLLVLLGDHVEQEQKLDAVNRQIADAIKAGVKPEVTEPDWEPTPWECAFPVLVQWISVPKLDEDRLREYLAAMKLGGPNERSELVAELDRLDREGYRARLDRIVREQCPDCASRIPAPSGGIDAPTGVPAWRTISETATDLFTTTELALLANVGSKKTLMNRLSASRNSSDPSQRPPAPAALGTGTRDDAYSYGAIRTWLLAQWPASIARFPESFADAQRILAAC